MFLNLILLKQKSDNAVACTVQLLNRLKISVTKTAVEETLQEHPDYPSLLSISDSLSRWKVNNTCLQADVGKLTDLPVPFIAHLKNRGGLFITINSVSEKEIIYADPEKDNKVVVQGREDFLKQWSGVVLIAERTNKSGEKNYSGRRRTEILQQTTIPLIIISCLLLITTFVLSIGRSLNLATIILPFILFTGCVVTSLLLWYEVDQSNPLLQQICSAGKNTNCKAVLQSKEAKLFGWLTWSEMGFYYFSGSFLYVLMIRQQSSFALIAWLNLLALPYTVFSIYYQWRVVKQWCPLCLMVQALLVSEFVIFYFAFWNQVSFRSINFSTIYYLSIAFLLPIFFWAFTKNIFIKAKAGQRYKMELNRLKHNPQIFEALLQKQKAITTNPEGLGITIGNLKAPNTIIKVCNPYCGPCAKAHPAIEELLKENENVKVQIIFTATEDEKDSRSKPVKHLMALDEKRDNQLTREALDDWYLPEKKDYEVFAVRYPLNGELQWQNKKLAAMSNWCKETEIEFTPTFFINGKQLPEIYSLNDLKYFLAE